MFLLMRRSSLVVRMLMTGVRTGPISFCAPTSPLLCLMRPCSSGSLTDHPLVDKVHRMRYLIFGRRLSKAQLARRGRDLYANCVEGYDYNQISSLLSLPDTFNSWVTIVHLHVWMLMGRVMQEGKDGLVLRNELVEGMWEDVSKRIELVAGVRKKKVYVQFYYERFVINILGLDEGLLGDDKELASALFRHMDFTDPTHLEFLVAYVRAQVNHLNKLDARRLLRHAGVTWLPLRLS